MIRYECDSCHAEVACEEDLYVIDIAPKRMYRNIDKRTHTRMEVCKKCRDAVYVRLMGGR